MFLFFIDNNCNRKVRRFLRVVVKYICVSNATILGGKGEKVVNTHIYDPSLFFFLSVLFQPLPLT